MVARKVESYGGRGVRNMEMLAWGGGRLIREGREYLHATPTERYAHDLLSCIFFINSREAPVPKTDDIKLFLKYRKLLHRDPSIWSNHHVGPTPGMRASGKRLMSGIKYWSTTTSHSELRKSTTSSDSRIWRRRLGAIGPSHVVGADVKIFTTEWNIFYS